MSGCWPAAPAGRLAVIACGKAAMPMAAEAARHYGDDCSGIVIFPGDRLAKPKAPAPGLRLYPASHPVPDRGSLRAARAALALAGGLTPDDLLLVLLSGGGSSLMCLPAGGVTLREKQALTQGLLGCGAPIGEINCVRKHLSGVKGGRLAQASAAPVVTLAISDVPGDDSGAIASGPTAPDPSTSADARAVLDRYRIAAPASVLKALRDPAAETPGTADEIGGCEYRIVASGDTALRAAARWCREHGIEPLVLGDRVAGEAGAVAKGHALQALDFAGHGQAVCLLSGGETTVKLGPDPGIGGRNTQYALALALALDGHPAIWALAADTDGIDGRGGHSGAMVGPHTLERGRRAEVDAADCLRRNDSATYFRRAGGLLEGGPTGTNVNDFRAILINSPGQFPVGAASAAILFSSH